MSVYRDGFRVWPYGEPHDDWLRLDQRRVNNPVTRLSNNQVVGRSRAMGNPELADQTNREGILQSRALEDLRRHMAASGYCAQAVVRSQIAFISATTNAREMRNLQEKIR